MVEEKRTEFAMAAIDFAGMFNSLFGETPVSGFIVQLTAPEGPSTGGGVQARQHITMINRATGVTQVVGGCNTVEKTAELRSFSFVADSYEKRHEGQPFPMGQGQYNELCQKFEQFLGSQGFTVTTVQGPKQAAGGGMPAKKSSAGLIIALIVALLVIGGGLAAYFLYFKQA